MHTHSDNTTCKDLLGSLSAYVDGELGEELCHAIEEHMAGCEHCRVVVDTLSKTIYLYRTAGAETAVPDEVKDRLFHTLKMDDLLKTSRKTS